MFFVKITLNEWFQGRLSLSWVLHFLLRRIVFEIFLLKIFPHNSFRIEFNLLIKGACLFRVGSSLLDITAFKITCFCPSQKILSSPITFQVECQIWLVKTRIRKTFLNIIWKTVIFIQISQFTNSSFHIIKKEILKIILHLLNDWKYLLVFSKKTRMIWWKLREIWGHLFTQRVWIR